MHRCKVKTLVAVIWKVTSQVAAIVKDAENVDHALAVATPVDDEVPRILHNSKRRSRRFAAETQALRPDAVLKIALVQRTGTFHVGLDITKSPDNRIFIAQRGVPSEFRLAPLSESLGDRGGLVLKEQLFPGRAF